MFYFIIDSITKLGNAKYGRKKGKIINHMRWLGCFEADVPKQTLLLLKY